MFKKLNIIEDKNATIRKKSTDIELPITKEDEQFALEMLEYVKESQKPEIQEEYNVRAGVGLSAIQLGVSKKIIAIYFEEDDKIHEYLIANPVVTSFSVKPSYLGTGEACLSVPKDVEGYVYRHNKITVKFYDILKKEERSEKLDGYLSIVFQHELDHLEGILYYDRIDKKNPFKEIKGAIEI